MLLRGTIESIRFQNEQNGWTAALLRTEAAEGTPSRLVSITGILSGIAVGMTVSLTGNEETTKYGPSVKVSSWAESRPSDIEGIEKYLASGLIKNIGPVFARSIVETFGEQTLHVLDNEPERLREVKGIGKKRVASVIEAVREQTEIRSIMIWLKKYDIPNGLAAKIYAAYQGNAVAVLEENPYRLADDIGGVGFKKADRAAQLLGIPPTAPHRLRSGVLAVLKDAAAEGHTCLPVHELQKKAGGKDYLDVEAHYITETLSDPLFLYHSILIEDELVFLPMYYYSEKGIARRCKELLGREEALLPLLDETDIEQEEKATGFTYSEEQKQAILSAGSRDMLIITGGPGTGKTATTNAIISLLEKNDLKVRLAAPTGRAAKRMSEVTGHPASTIHRLLEYSQGDFQRDENMPLDGDAFIIDEVSMIDTVLMNSLLKAIPEEGKLILVGDVDQLPSVGAGCVLRDLIDSGLVPTVRLTKIYRQAMQSKIITSAHMVNHGQTPPLESIPGMDFHFLECSDPQQIQDYVTDLVTRQVPSINGIPTESVQVLCPMRRDWDPIASTVLNRRIQQEVNPGGKVIVRRGDTEFRLGDRIMQVKNNYDKDIFNGDTGVITTALHRELDDGTIMLADFDGKTVMLTKRDTEDLELSYACTIHKSQGSEYPAVVIPVHDSQYIMLRRNLLYTGITRAKKLCILVGTRKAVHTAVSREDTHRRHTHLKEILNTV